MKSKNLSRLICPRYDPGFAITRESIPSMHASVSRKYVSCFSHLSLKVSVMIHEVVGCCRVQVFFTIFAGFYGLGRCRTLIDPPHSLVSRKII